MRLKSALSCFLDSADCGVHARYLSTGTFGYERGGTEFSASSLYSRLSLG